MIGAPHVLFRLLQISNKYGNYSLFTRKCNFVVVLGWGPKKMTMPEMPGGEGGHLAHLELN